MKSSPAENMDFFVFWWDSTDSHMKEAEVTATHVSSAVLGTPCVPSLFAQGIVQAVGSN